MVALLLVATEGAHEHVGSLWSRYVDLLTDPAHLMMEGTLILVVDVLIGAILWPFAKRMIQNHDRQHHAGHMTEETDS